ncbi:MAG: hypothetical protein K0R99_4805 [Microbacterium sp.]|nr:hypothetical protein [Microbacterium sp.]
MQSVARVAYAVVAILPPAILILFLVGSLFFSGGQVSAGMDPKWGIVWAYPLFVVPTVLLVALGAVLVVLAIILAATASDADVPGLRGLVGPTAASIVAAIGFALLVPDGGTRTGDVTFGDQWRGAVVCSVALVILLIGIAVARTRPQDRQSRAR